MLEDPRIALEKRTESGTVETLSGSEDSYRASSPEVASSLGTETSASRLTQIDKTREHELSELNAVRASLGLPPTQTSVALAALNEEEEKLLAAEPHNELNRTKNIPARSPSFGELVPERKEGLRVRGPIRRYFEELGPEETMRRFQDGGPGFATKMRELILAGNLNETVWRMERLSPDFPNARNTPTILRSIDDMDAAYNMHAIRTIEKLERLKQTGDETVEAAYADWMLSNNGADPPSNPQ